MPVTAHDLTKLAREMRIAPPAPPVPGDPVRLTLLSRDGTDVGRLPTVPLAAGTVVLGRLIDLLGTLADGSTPPATAEVFAEVQWNVLLQRRPAELGVPEPPGFAALDGLSLPTINVLLEPRVVEATTDLETLPVVRYVVKATVTLTSGGVSSGPVSLPELTLALPAVPVPSMLLLFRHPHFKSISGGKPGFVALVVPGDSPIRGTDAVDRLLAPLDATVTALRRFTRFAGFSRALNTVLSVLNNQPGVGFRAASAIDNLEDIRIKGIRGGAEIIEVINRRVEADNEVSSLMLLGVPGIKVEFFKGHRQNGNAGRFSITIGPELFARVPDLHQAEPQSEPANRLRVHVPARNFGDSVSSLQFR